MNKINLPSSNWYNAFFLALGYCLSLYFIQFFLVKAGIGTEVPNAVTLMRWDAGVYESIMREGYTYPDERCNNTGQYLLFPMVWRLLHVGVVGISIANMVLFSASFAIVCGMYPVSTKEKFLWLTTPSLYFMGVPYSESLFCLLTVLLFYAIKNNIKWLIWLSLVLLSLTRATAIFLIPSLLIMELISNDRKLFLRATGNYLVNYALPIIGGLAIFVLIQYYQVGIWFAYFKQQIKYLGHEWAFPKLPFQDYYGGPRVIWLCGLAALVCVVSLVVLAKHVYRWIVRNQKFDDKILTLTLSYFPLVLFSIVFCNPTWGGNTTNIFGLHRYTLCTPFIFVFLYHVIGESVTFKTKHFVYIFLVSNVIWLTMGSYIHIQYFLYWNFPTFIAFGYMLHNEQKHEWVLYALIGINVLLQVSLHQQFLSNLFPD